MSRCVDDVDAMLIVLVVHSIPETGSSRGGNGDTTFLLLLHPVHNSRTVMHLTNLVRNTGVKQYTFGRGCLARIHVRGNTNIAITAQGVFSSHSFTLNKI